MKTAIRLYLNTSKGNDPFLYRQLNKFRLKPKYDQHLHAFYFDTTLPTLFHLSFHSLIAENMYIQIGQSFPATSEIAFQQHIEKFQFKNYLPIKRGLIENMTLNIIVRETQYPLSDNVMTAILQQTLQKQIVKKEYFVDILGASGADKKDNMLPYYELKEIVERKWQEEDTLRETKMQNLLEGREQLKMLEGENQKGQNSIVERSSRRKRKERQLTKIQQSVIEERNINNQLASLLPYYPNLTLYVRRNQGRILLKVNKQEMYKHGWKKRVGWGPIRQSIVASILDQTTLLSKNQSLKLWDPFCGSGTFALVAAAQYYNLGVRGEISQNFNWPHWKMMKKQYLQEYQKTSQSDLQQKKGMLKLICSDINFQAVNYTIGNLKQLLKQMPKIEKEQTDQNAQQNLILKTVKRIKPTDQIFQIKQNQWIALCGDFQKIAENVLQGEKVSIISNLPYTQGRSAQHIPLNQLHSLYRRFSKLLRQNKDKINNAFIIVNNDQTQIINRNHFLNISDQKWNLISSFESGGRPIGLYAWNKNEAIMQFQDHKAVYDKLLAEKQEIISLPEQADIKTHLISFRKKIQQIQKKNYFIPKHMLHIRKGWKRVMEKRRRRHLLTAYELFSKRKDKIQAFTEYSQKKLELNMLKRGTIWRKRNMRLLNDTDLVSLEKDLKKEFEGRIEEALERSQQKQRIKKQRLEAKKAQREKDQLRKKKLQKGYKAVVPKKLNKNGEKRREPIRNRQQKMQSKKMQKKYRNPK